MKTLYINTSSNIVIDEEKRSASKLDTQREAISRIYLVPEAMHVVFGEGEKNQEFDVKKDDIIVIFYDRAFDKQAVVVKSKDWAKNLKIYNEEQQKAKEEWAFKKVTACCEEDSESA